MATGNDHLTPEDEAESALELFEQGLKTLASACSIYEEWTEVTDPCATPTHHPLYKRIVRTYNGK